MSDFGQCFVCKEYDFLSKHECAPIFYFKHESWGDDFEEIRAWNFEDAAERFAKLFNEDGDYALMHGPEEVIISDGKTEKKFKVYAEQTIDYKVEEHK